MLLIGNVDNAMRSIPLDNLKQEVVSTLRSKYAGYDRGTSSVSHAAAYGDLARTRPGATARQVPGLSPATACCGVPPTRKGRADHTPL